MSAEASSTSVATRPDDPKTVLYYRLRSAITDGNEAGVCQILKLRSMSSKVWLKLCPHLLWDKIEPMQTDSIQTMWFDILGTELEDYLEVNEKKETFALRSASLSRSSNMDQYNCFKFLPYVRISG